MKEGVKFLIVILCLIVVGLITFIVADKVINKKVEELALENDNIKVANDAIKGVLNDKEWIDKNLRQDFDTSSGNKIISEELYIMKLSNQDGTPVYIACHTINDAPCIKVITYKDGRVVVSKTPISGEYSLVFVNKEQNQVAIINDPTSEGNLYQVVGSEFSKFGYNNEDYAYCVLYGNQVSKEEYEKCLNKMTKWEPNEKNKLNAKNIDDIIK